MSKRSHFTTVTPVPAGISRETVLAFLHCHTDMIDLNPLVIDRHPIKPPPEASPEEFTCQWYSVSDRISYLPGVKGKLTFNACFHDLPDGLQTHIYAPMGLNMKGRWTLGGTLPGEPIQPAEIGIGVPKQGLWLREDVEMKCNIMMTSFVKGTTKKTHGTLVDRLMERSHLREAEGYNNTLKEQLELRNQYPPDYHSSADAGPGMGNMSHSSVYSSDGKPDLHYSNSVSDSASLRSGGGSIHDPRHSYHQSPQPMHAPYQLYSSGQYNPQLAPAPLRTPSNPYVGGNPPYPNQPPQSFHAELPGMQTKTPIEMEGGQVYDYKR